MTDVAINAEKVHIYGPQFSNFVRNVQLVCEEKSIEYTLGFDVAGEGVEFKGEQHGLWHPYKKVPVLIHGDVVLGETSVICRYLDNNFSGLKLQPACPKKSAEVDQWCQIISLYIDKAIVRDYLLEIVFPKGEGGAIREQVLTDNRPELERALMVVEQQLGEKAYLVGASYSLADIMLVPILYYVKVLLQDKGLVDMSLPLCRYLDRISQRQAAKNVLVPKG